jgi:hypothetical protein
MAEQTRSERLSSAYKRLVESAESLSAAADEFGKPVAEIDLALERLNLGLLTWEKVSGGDDDDLDWWERDVGYARIRRQWGLAIRKINGNHNHPGEERVEEWLFNDAPRSYRIEALDKLPDLLEHLIKNSDKTAKKLREKVVEAQELATAITKATEELRAQKKERR